MGAPLSTVGPRVEDRGTPRSRVVMRRRHRRLVPAMLAVLALALLAASLASACTEKAELRVRPTSGPPGTEATVAGNMFGNGKVDVHWNKASGPLLRRVEGPRFTIQETIPPAEAGVYYIKAVAKRDGRTWTASAAFEVIGRDAPEAGAPPSGGPGGAAQGPRSTGPGAERTGGGSGTPGGGRGDERRGREEDSRRRATDRGRDRSGPERSREAGRVPASTRARAVRGDSGRTVFGGSLGSTAGGPLGSSAGDPSSQGPATSERSSARHRWSGLRDRPGAESGPVPRRTAPRVPSLRDRTPRAVKPSWSRLAPGIGLLAVGLVAMFAGFAVAVVRRRRAPAEAGEWPPA